MKKYIRHHLIMWSSIIIFAISQILWGYIENILDFIVELLILSCCFSLLLEINRLKLGWLMGLGWGLYGSSLLIDIWDEYYISEALATTFDLADDILKLGVVCIGIAFYKAIKGKTLLIRNLRTEVAYRVKLEAQLNKVICLDELTQIGNRRALFQSYQTLVTQYQSPQLIFIDLDNFKQLNDTQGHQQGDQLLKDFASCLSEKCANKGEAYRFGGDEFIIIYDGVDHDHLMTSIKNKMHDLFESSKVSLSYGCMEIDLNESADEQILKVDVLMYENKQQRKSLRQTQRLFNQ